MGKKKLAKKGPSSEELARLDREVQAVLRQSKVGKKPFFSLTGEEHLDLFRLLRPCIEWTDAKVPKPQLIEDPVAEIIFHTLWTANTGLAVMGAKRFNPFAYTDDSIQDAHLGLREGLLRFDPERGIRPATYIMWWIRHAVLRNRPHSENGAIPLKSNALSQIKKGRAEKPVVFSYDAAAQQRGIEDVSDLALMGDTRSVSQDKLVEIRQIFHLWRAKLVEAAAYVEQEHPVDFLLFSLESGYGRYPKAPVRMKVLKRFTRMSEGEIDTIVNKTIKRIGKRCGFYETKKAKHFIDAMVEYSLHLGIPL